MGKYGYSGIRRGNSAVLLGRLEIFNKLSIFYVPSLILLRVLFKQDARKYRIYDSLMVLHAILYLIIGQRTIAVALLMTILFLYIQEGKKIKLQTIIILTVSFLSLLVVSNYVGNTRSLQQYDVTILKMIETGISSFIGECGWSVFPLMVIVGATPQDISFSLGRSYFASVMSFLPTFFDPTGILTRLGSLSNEMWLTEYTGLNFGVGYSLVAEAYYNFAWYGLIPIFIIGIILPE